MEARLATVIVTVVAPLTVPELAVIDAEPGATAVTKPELLTLALVTSELLQAAEPVTFFVLPSL